MHGKRLVLAGLATLVCAATSTAQERSLEDQIADALLAAPASLRPSATVLGYGGTTRPDDVLTVLRDGGGALICLADDPADEGFHTACYHASLDPYMVLGRRLRAEGRDRSEIMDARHAALAEGRITMPEHAALYSVSADSSPLPDGGELAGERRLTVVYVPGATGEELGLPTRPEGDVPWLMLPGTPWAHIMIAR